MHRGDLNMHSSDRGTAVNVHSASRHCADRADNAGGQSHTCHAAERRHVPATNQADVMYNPFDPKKLEHMSFKDITECIKTLWVTRAAVRDECIGFFPLIHVFIHFCPRYEILKKRGNEKVPDQDKDHVMAYLRWSKIYSNEYLGVMTLGMFPPSGTIASLWTAPTPPLIERP